MRYRIEPYDGAVVCLRSTINPPQPGHRVSIKGWGEFMRGKFHDDGIRCGYMEFYSEPHIGDVARKLDGYMSEFGPRNRKSKFGQMTIPSA